MAMYFHGWLRFDELKNAFDCAKRKGIRYVGVIEEVHSARYSVNVNEEILYCSDAMDLIRAVREKGLHPQASRIQLRRVFNTDHSDFATQLRMSPPKQFAVNLPPDAQDAYQRYLQAVEARKQADMPKVKTGKRWFGRD